MRISPDPLQKTETPTTHNPNPKQHAISPSATSPAYRYETVPTASANCAAITGSTIIATAPSAEDRFTSSTAWMYHTDGFRRRTKRCCYPSVLRRSLLGPKTQDARTPHPPTCLREDLHN
jgi:hypothetical protein